MKRLLFILFLLPLLTSNAQKLEAPAFFLSGVKFHLKITSLADSLTSYNIKIISVGKTELIALDVSGGTAQTEFSFPETGDYQIVSAADEILGSIRIIPGWLSIVPPLLAILLALVIRQVVVSLAAGIFAGAVFIYDYNPVTALLRFADTFMIEALIDKDHMFIIVFTLLIGGVVGIISKNGGTAGLANQITRVAKTARSGMVSSWLLGVMIFFDDYANSLIIGNMMRPITDKLKISREKLAYIVDSTAAPVASIVFISTWIGYEVGLIEDGLRSISSDANAYDVFLSTIPYSFYPIGAVMFVLMVASLNRDFGPMFKAELRARETGKVLNDKTKVQGIKESERDIYTGDKARWYNGAVPIFIILFGTMGGLYYTGIMSLKESGISDYNLQNIINHSDSYSSLLWASFAACIVAIVMSISQRILTLEESVAAWQRGIQSMMVAVIILVFAWAISSVTNQLYTADYIMMVISDKMNPQFLPAVVFIVCSLTAFSTGTSWGTMAIVMPIILPLTHKISGVAGIGAEEYNVIMPAVISSVLAGSVFGDHCSPIADTTILSSLASKCNHIDHVNTQLPYALFVGFVSIIIGYIPAGFGMNPFISIGLILATLFIVLLIFGKKLPVLRN